MERRTTNTKIFTGGRRKGYKRAKDTERELEILGKREKEDEGGRKCVKERYRKSPSDIRQKKEEQKAEGSKSEIGSKRARRPESNRVTDWKSGTAEMLES